MKSLKETLVQEGLIKRQAGMDMRAKIEAWLASRGIRKYTINDDLTIDIKGDVYLNHYKEKQLPDYIQIRKVTGYFDINNSSNLETLKGCPQEVGGSFDCSECPKLESLEYAPQKVGRSFDCCECPIKSLEGAPQEVWGSFYCYRCKELESLKGAPQKVGRHFHCDECPKLESLEGAPQYVYGDF